MRYMLAVLIFALWPGLTNAGAWMRDAGKTFLSISNQTDLANGLPSGPGDGFSIFAEHGLGGRLTIGADGWRTNGSASFAAFMRLPLTRAGAKHNAAVDLALGGYRAQGQPLQPTIKLSLGWGRGFQSRLASGWIQMESSVERRIKTRLTIVKTDMTLGFSTSDSRKMMFQAFLAKEGAAAVSIKLAPSYVIKIGSRADLVVGLVLGARHSRTRDLVIGTWITF